MNSLSVVFVAKVKGYQNPNIPNLVASNVVARVLPTTLAGIEEGTVELALRSRTGCLGSRRFLFVL